MIIKYIGEQGRRPRQAQGQDHRLHLLRRRLRPRADPAARAVRQGLRLHREAVSGAGGRDAEPVRPVAQRAPRPSGLDGHVGLGRHEPDRRQGSHQDQLPDGQVRRHLVVGRRGRRACRRPGAKGYLSLNFNGIGANYPGDPGHQEARGRQGQEPDPEADKVGENFYNRGVLQLRARRRGDPQRADDHRQEGGERRGRAARLRDAEDHRGALEGDRPRGLRGADRQRDLRRTTTATTPPTCSNGTAPSGSRSPTGSRP